MGLCSTYIDKLEGYRRMLNKQAASGKVEELYKTLKSSRFIDEELKEFYQNFDNSFFSIFPDFVKRFNELLPEEERIIPKQDERLTTELRIFALIRLGNYGQCQDCRLPALFHYYYLYLSFQIEESFSLP